MNEEKKLNFAQEWYQDFIGRKTQEGKAK